MIGVKDLNGIYLERITPRDGYEYFFGYYDIPALHESGKYYLCHRVKFMDRLPKANDVCEIGIINLEKKEFEKLTETLAWNFQQGSMLQWSGDCKDEFIYNEYDGKEYKGVVQNFVNNERRLLEKPVAAVSKDGRWALGLNMSRIYDFRPGYGYNQIKDPFAKENVPQNDGIYLIDMSSGKSQLLIDYDVMDRIFNYGRKDKKLVVNHITFNKESSRFVFLLRKFPDEGGKWETAIGTSDLQGNIYKLKGFGYASHYNWKSDGVLMIHAGWGYGDGLYELSDLSNKEKKYESYVFEKDIHCSYSPDEKWIIGDGYPDEEEYRNIYLYDRMNGAGTSIGKFFSPKLASVDIRCDLHCRWLVNGYAVCMDSIHEGSRAIYIINIKEAKKKIQGGNIK